MNAPNKVDAPRRSGQPPTRTRLTTGATSGQRQTLDPHLSAVYRKKVEQLAVAFAHGDEAQRQAARTALRSFITAIMIPPGEGPLEVRGDLVAMLSAAAGERNGGTLAAVALDGCGGGI